jgi:outer membrane protein OmpA-like peptidoglycan-associated protein
MTGCLHNRGVHTVPHDRDYEALEKHHYEEGQPLVAEAHRKGAHHFAPFEYDSAETYLDFADDAHQEGDRKGHQDYAKLIKEYSADALANGSGIPDKGMLAMPENHAGAVAEFDRIKALYKELDPCKAKLVAPHIYAHIETSLAQAEHEIKEREHYPEGIRHLRFVEPDIDAIWAMDADNDGVRDMDDGEPWIPEDPDGYQDGDGIPEPKPYPVLSDIHFASDSAKLSDKAKGYLAGIAHMLIDGYSEATLILDAYTDSDASDEYNIALSERREESVKNFLVEAGAQASQIKSAYHGETNPKGDNSTSAGKAENRRCELRLDSEDPVSPYCND